MINIIGGGISGLSTALAFETNGIEYNLFERNSEITYENVGLGISSNMYHILKEWGILDETIEIGAEIYKFHFVDENLNYINSFKMKNPPLCVNRKLFYELILKKLDKNKIHLNSNKSKNDFHKSEIVISAEGINSKTRNEIYPELKIRDSNQILWRGISEIELNEKFKNSYHDFIGNNLRFAIIHSGKNYYSWYMVKEKQTDDTITFDRNILKSYFKNYHSIVTEVIEKSENIYFSELLDIKPSNRKNLAWFNENILMIGDAIHPTTPNMANGACLAMEDSYLLANLLNEKSYSTKEIYEIFQAKRTKKTNSIVIQSWWFGKMLHQKSRIANYFIKIGIKFTPKFVFVKIYSNILIETKV